MSSNQQCFYLCLWQKCVGHEAGEGCGGAEEKSGCSREWQLPDHVRASPPHLAGSAGPRAQLLPSWNW